MSTTHETAPGPAGARFFLQLNSALAILLVAASVAWAVDLYRMVGLVLFMEQYVSGILALAFLLLFFGVPARVGEPRAVPPWYDILAGLTGFAAAGYIAVNFVDLGTQMFFAPLDGLIASAVVVVLALEGIRRTVGWPLVVTVLVFIAYGLLGHLIPGVMSARETGAMQLIYYLGFDSNAVLGTPIMIAATIVIAFVLFGNLLDATGGGEFFNDISVATMGRYRGGSAKIAVVSSALFGTISGSAVANVVSGGIVTIPMMIRAGYKKYQAAAIEAVASTGGSIMPPVMGAAAFVMAEFLQISYGEVMVAAAIPAILYFAVLFIVSDLEAARAGIARIEESLIPRVLFVLRHGWHFTLPFATLVYALFWMNLQAEEAALYSCVTLLLCTFIFGYRGKRPKFSALVGAVRRTGYGVLDIIMICCGAGIVIGVLAVTGLAFGLTLILVTFAKHSLLLLLVLAAVISTILGMGMPTVAVYVLLAALIAPALSEAGVMPLAAHMFVLYFGMMSFVTPPVAVAAFAAASIAKTDPVRTGFEAMRFGWVAYIVPFLFVYSPTLIMDGNPLYIAFDFVTALGGIWLMSMGVVGYSLRPIGWLMRVAYAAAGAALLAPLALSEYVIYGNVSGLVFGALLLGREYAERSRGRVALETGPADRGRTAA
ncbi:MAG TPA: TRAP transporter fused permease subunit [Xanthobacteraceae bacterium]|nr:TRAP transporter fused permease subunit [Xanthobacteraceae bacterium]